MRRKIAVVVAAAVVMALAACDTQPATNVTSSAATLNANGSCAAGVSGDWWYQLRNASAGSGWSDVGPAHSYACGQNSGTVALEAYRATGLKSAQTYQFRIRSTVNGGNHTFDSQGTSGGTNYDWFATPAVVIEEAESPPAEYLSVDPTTGETVASASGCKIKRVKNPRRGTFGGVLMFKVLLTIEWKYCNGQIRWSRASQHSCETTFVGDSVGYECRDPEGVEVRSVSYGGNPEHSEYTYKWRIRQVSKGPIPGVVYYSSTWCASTAISGSNASDNHRRTGSCDITRW